MPKSDVISTVNGELFFIQKECASQDKGPSVCDNVDSMGEDSFISPFVCGCQASVAIAIRLIVRLFQGCYVHLIIPRVPLTFSARAVQLSNQSPELL